MIYWFTQKRHLFSRVKIFYNNAKILILTYGFFTVSGICGRNLKNIRKSFQCILWRNAWQVKFLCMTYANRQQLFCYRKKGPGHFLRTKTCNPRIASRSAVCLNSKILVIWTRGAFGILKLLCCMLLICSATPSIHWDLPFSCFADLCEELAEKLVVAFCEVF